MNEEIIIYTDGSSEPNPGHSGIGYVMRYGKYEKQVSKYIGNGTNNVAELSAIYQSLQDIKTNHRNKTIHLYSDSQYAIKILTKAWRYNANKELIDEIIPFLNNFPNLKFTWVKAHNNDKYNEIADELAGLAVKNKGNSTELFVDDISISGND